MKKLKISEVPWMIMTTENKCQTCDRRPYCTYKDLKLCFMSNVDEVIAMTKKEAEELKEN